MYMYMYLYAIMCILLHAQGRDRGGGPEGGLAPLLTFFFAKFDITIISLFLFVQDFFYKSSPPPPTSLFNLLPTTLIMDCTFSLTILSRPLCVTNTAVIRGLPDPTTYTYPAVLTRFHHTRVKFCRCKQRKWAMFTVLYGCSSSFVYTRSTTLHRTTLNWLREKFTCLPHWTTFRSVPLQTITQELNFPSSETEK